MGYAYGHMLSSEMMTAYHDLMSSILSSYDISVSVWTIVCSIAKLYVEFNSDSHVMSLLCRCYSLS